ncbi:MAG: T9SS type A sorting domain-containing protein [Chitinophagaceae bacterium]|uniref:T9SS type A sorting domain-containing protein n=1 Tax=unclassified Paraflavitalea TaxID=2798305 RepID=UPI003D33AF00|nr:T9SS type A sorting domain-containing protein [Chitinophagaceae bacterium]
MKIFYTLSIFLISTLAAKSQDRNTPSTPAGDVLPKLIKFYPNPATSFINFELQNTNEKDLNFQIYNFLGKKVYEVNNINSNSKTTVNLSDFYRGVYIFQLRDKSGKVVDSGKFQVSK